MRLRTLPASEAGQGRPDKIAGREYIHSMVTTGCVAWTDASLTERREELCWPPRKMLSTSSNHVGPALLENFERYMFGCKLSEALPRFAAQYRLMAIFCVADSAKANLKAVKQLFDLLLHQAASAGVVLTCCFSPCLLHQLMRVVLLLMEHRKLSAALFSITRLQQQSTSRARTAATMKELLERRFVFKADTPVPDIPVTAGYFRRRLADMLHHGMDNMLEMDEEIYDQRCFHVDRLLRFFNGDLTNKMEWVHCCHGCHSSREHARNDAP